MYYFSLSGLSTLYSNDRKQDYYEVLVLLFSSVQTFLKSNNGPDKDRLGGEKEWGGGQGKGIMMYYHDLVLPSSASASISALIPSWTGDFESVIYWLIIPERLEKFELVFPGGMEKFEWFSPEEMKTSWGWAEPSSGQLASFFRLG